MAAAIPHVARTPQKIYSTTNVCCLCGFSFVVKEVDNEGNIQIKKLVKLKLKLTEEKQTAIRDVIQTDLPPNAEGVCVRCFGKVEKVLKYQKEIKDILTTFEENMKRNRAKTPGSSTRKKRGRASPKTHEQVTIHRPAVEHATATCVSETRYRPIMPQPPQTEGSLQGCKSFPDITGHDTLEIAVDVLRTSAEPAKEDFGSMTYFLISC
ncbi:uncharacterized protein LOC134276988 [Saccostrea cucullata]|uniref:uncharacterized protein LOC134276988 n=1 Tax=Saccostrea cuccullata TaxID=36930 RepID=UPI002ED4E2E2